VSCIRFWKYKKLLRLALLLCFGMTAVVAAAAESAHEPDFPRLMGMNIGAKNYDDTTYVEQLAKPDVVILGFYNTWKNRGLSIRDAVRRIKQRNPNVLIGQYTILPETYDPADKRYADKDKGNKIDKEKWWLLDANGSRVQWTDKHDAWDVNITSWSKPDSSGRRYPEWLAERDFAMYFKSVPEFDIWYFDNAISRPAVKSADWDGDGKNDNRDDPRIAEAYRRGHVAHWETARKLHPTALFIGNSDDVSSPEYSGKLQGAFMEAVIGASWSMERWKGWDAVMERYRSAIIHTAEPHIVGFNVHGSKVDYQRMRYGLASCLLDDGYFSYTDEDVEYGSVVWFDEYDVELGKAIDHPPLQPWQNGVYRRRFENGMALVNPDMLSKTVSIEAGYWRFSGKQAPEVNNGTVATSVTLPGKDGVILIKEQGAR